MQKLVLAVICLAATTPTFASYGNWKLCDNFLECGAMATIFFAVIGVPVSIGLAMLAYHFLYRDMEKYRKRRMSLLTGPMGYVATMFTVAILNDIVPVPYHLEAEFRLAAVLVLLPVLVSLACKRFR